MADPTPMQAEHRAEKDIARGCEYPYDGRVPADWAEMAALGILYDMSDRRGIKSELRAVECADRPDIVDSIARIIRAARPHDTPKAGRE